MTSVVHSVLAPGALRAEVERRYELGEPVRCELLAHTTNDSYLVEAPAGAFVLRVYGAGARSAAEVGYEVELLRWLVGRAAPVAGPVAARDGAAVWRVVAPEGERFCVLFARAPGALPGDPHPSAAFGRAAAAVHSALSGFSSVHARQPIDWEILVDRPFEVLRRFLPHRGDALAYLDDVAGGLRRRLDDYEGALEHGAIHGDLHGGQGHVAPDGSVTLFDFDDCGVGWRAYDLAGFRWWQHLNGRSEESWAAFVAGYREERDVREAELAAAPLFVAVRHLWLLGQTARSAERFGRWWADDRFFNRRIGQLTDWLTAVGLTT
jgi:Ser/Thr protein kinase RdoA (MazF antagonist)